MPCVTVQLSISAPQTAPYSYGYLATLLDLVVVGQKPGLCSSRLGCVARRGLFACLLAGELLARLHGVGVQHVLEGEQEGGGDDALGDLGADACPLVSVAPCQACWVMHSPPYKPAYPSSLMILLNVVTMLSRLSPLPATCIRLLTVMYGYVMLVASSLPRAPM